MKIFRSDTKVAVVTLLALKLTSWASSIRIALPVWVGLSQDRRKFASMHVDRRLYETVMLRQAGSCMLKNGVFPVSQTDCFSGQMQSFCPTVETVKCSPLQAVGPSLNGNFGP